MTKYVHKINHELKKDGFKTEIKSGSNSFTWYNDLIIKW